MDDKQSLKIEIQSKLDKLHNVELREVADFVSFLISKNLNNNSQIESKVENFNLSSWIGCLNDNSDLNLKTLEKELKEAWTQESVNNDKTSH